MIDEEKLLIAKVNDLFSLCQKHASAKFSLFLNENEKEIIKEHIGNRIGFNSCFFGGYEDAERCMFGVFPEWEESGFGEFPISIIEVESKFQKKLSHRDYLGTVLSLRIDRGKIGDILVYENGAYMFTTSDIADYIVFNIKKISNCGVTLKKVDIRDIELPKREYIEISAVAASLRLDAVLAAALNISRRESALYINGGRVEINHKPTSDVSYILKEGDLMSVKGSGRIILDSVGTNTRSGRIHILLKKCVR